MNKKFPFSHQLDSSDCGPACLKMISEYYGKKKNLQYLREISYITKEGVSLLTISNAAEKIGFKTLKLEISLNQLIENAPLPCIIYWNQEHFVVLYNVTKKRGVLTFHIADPSVGIREVDTESFCNSWILTKNKNRGAAIFLEPSDDFLLDDEDSPKLKTGFNFLTKYFLKYKKYYSQLVLGIVGGSLLSLLLPLVTQSIVDYGIKSKDITFITLILLFQLLLFFGNTTIDFIRSHLLLHISTRINVSIVSDYLIKLMKLPIRYFDSRRVGDIMTRIEDNKRIEQFLSATVLNTLFSVINFLMLSFVLGYYSIPILLIFLTGSFLSIFWTFLFMEKRKNIDYKLFNFMSRNRENTYEIVNAMQEIKLNDFELFKRWEWEKVQLRLFRLNIKTLSLEQYQQIGSTFFSQLKNLLITFFAAKGVIDNQLSLGMMLSISFIIGLLNSPIDQFISFFKLGQSAKISLERMSEIFSQENEENITETSTISNGINLENNGISLQNLSFQYEGPKSQYVLKNINLIIPFGKITAIVGTSGSGKTTLMKLLLKFYEPTEGQVKVDSLDLKNISAKYWRNQCGVVLQEGYIFDDTLKRNIIMGDEGEGSNEALMKAIRNANIEDFLENLPLGINTKIGVSGIGLSTGQKQRILIARAIYKNPSILLFDEATSSLDANNERIIVENLNIVFKDKTVVVIAHRLSTVKNADQIVVLNNGELVEIGTHNDLVTKKGYYYNLVKNQLELGT